MSEGIFRLWRATFGRSQFLRFGLVGVAGFAIDASVLTFLVEIAGTDPYSARAISFLCAATATWWMNRRFTFDRQDDQPAGRQWFLFLVVNAGGAAINYGVYVLALQLWPLALEYPALGAALGAIAGLLFNFPATKYLVFRSGLPAPRNAPTGSDGGE